MFNTSYSIPDTIIMFKTKKIISQESQRVGEILKRAREEKGISLEKISREIKVQERYLEKIEKGEYQNMPPVVYVSGFVKRYASFLGLDFERISFLYKRERNIQERINSQKQDDSEVKRKIKSGRKNDFKKLDIFKSDFAGSFSKRKLFIITPKILTFLLGVFVLAGAVFYLWHQVSSFNTVPYLYISEPAEDQTVDCGIFQFKGQTEKDAEIKINGEIVYLDSSGNFSAEINLQEGLNTIIIEAENQFGRKAEITRRIIYEEGEN